MEGTHTCVQIQWLKARSCQKKRRWTDHVCSPETLSRRYIRLAPKYQWSCWTGRCCDSQLTSLWQAAGVSPSNTPQPFTINFIITAFKVAPKGPFMGQNVKALHFTRTLSQSLVRRIFTLWSSSGLFSHRMVTRATKTRSGGENEKILDTLFSCLRRLWFQLRTFRCNGPAAMRPRKCPVITVACGHQGTGM